MLSSGIVAMDPAHSTHLARSTPEEASRRLAPAQKKNLRLPLCLEDRRCQDRQGPNHRQANLKRGGI